MRLTFQPPCCLFAHHPSIPPLVSISSEVRVFSRNILIHKRAAKTFLISRRITFFVVITIIFVTIDHHHHLHDPDPGQVPLSVDLPDLQCALHHSGLRWICRPNIVLDGNETFLFKMRMKLFLWTVKIAMDSIGTKCMFQN